MSEQEGLFALPGPSPSPTARPARGRRGERWTRSVVADVSVVDSAALRDAALEDLDESIVISLGAPEDEPDDEPDAPAPEEIEIQNSDAAALRWLLGATVGVPHELAEALRIETVGLDVSEDGPGHLRVHWTTAVTITDLHEFRRHARDAAGTDIDGASFAELWNHAADPATPLAGVPGISRENLAAEVFRTAGRRHG